MQISRRKVVRWFGVIEVPTSGVTRRRASLASQVAGSGTARSVALRGLFILEIHLVSALIAYMGTPEWVRGKDALHPHLNIIRSRFLTPIGMFRGVDETTARAGIP